MSVCVSVCVCVCVCGNSRLLCDVPVRIGQNVDSVKSHPFFRGTDWDHIRLGGMGMRLHLCVYVLLFHSRDRPAAIPVHVKHMADTSNFDDFEEMSTQKKSTVEPH